MVALSGSQALTGNPYIDGLLSQSKWLVGLSFSFPSLPLEYLLYDPNELVGFSPANQQQRQAVAAIMTGQAEAGLKSVMLATSVASFVSNVVLNLGAGTLGDIAIAQSSQVDTAYGNFPATTLDRSGGDIWLGGSGKVPVAGSYDYQTLIHELGHAMGLKHSHEDWRPVAPSNSPAIPLDRDAIEWTIMSYRSYVGCPIGPYKLDAFPTTFMAYDILALQTMYGADYSAEANNTATTYRWDKTTGEMFINGVGKGQPANGKIFMTVWDGGGVDTYDLSDRTEAMTIDLRAGSASVLSQAQLAGVGDGKKAQGNVYNALLYKGNTASLIEAANGGSGNDKITGNEASNTLRGNKGNDTLDGLVGNDRTEGGEGNDIHVVDSLGDVVIEAAGAGGGSDTVLSSWISLDLASYANVENATLAGSLVLNLFGSAVGNVLVGNAAANTIDGRGGADRMMGGGGNDSYVVDNAADLVDETGGNGGDAVYTYIDIDLAKVTQAKGDVEYALMLGTAPLKAYGNALANGLQGNAGANVLDGRAGADVLLGLGGVDKMYAGVDSVRDTFIFSTMTDSGGRAGPASTWDQVIQFSQSAGSGAASSDVIDLRGIDADVKLAGDQTFRFVGAAFVKAGSGQPTGQVRVVDSGVNVNVEIDQNGDNIADMVFIVLAIDTLKAADFLL